MPICFMASTWPLHLGQNLRDTWVWPGRVCALGCRVEVDVDVEVEVEVEVEVGGYVKEHGSVQVGHGLRSLSHRGPTGFPTHTHPAHRDLHASPAPPTPPPSSAPPTSLQHIHTTPPPRNNLRIPTPQPLHPTSSLHLLMPHTGEVGSTRHARETDTSFSTPHHTTPHHSTLSPAYHLFLPCSNSVVENRRRASSTVPARSPAPPRRPAASSGCREREMPWRGATGAGEGRLQVALEGTAQQGSTAIRHPGSRTRKLRTVGTADPRVPRLGNVRIGGHSPL
jgi:hypothetical protein